MNVILFNMIENLFLLKKTNSDLEILKTISQKIWIMYCIAFFEYSFKSIYTEINIYDDYRSDSSYGFTVYMYMIKYTFSLRIIVR